MVRPQETKASISFCNLWVRKVMSSQNERKKHIVRNKDIFRRAMKAYCHSLVARRFIDTSKDMTTSII